MIIASTEVLLHLLANYGLKPLNFLKEFFPEMDKQAGSNQSQVRGIVLDFYKEAYKWMGENMLLFTSTLKKNIKQELDKFIEEWPKETSMQPLRINELEELGPKDQKKGINGECDMFDILEGVDIFNKFNDSWCEKVLAQVKWNEKKDMLEELIGAASVPKLLGNNYYPVLSMIKKVLNDSNVNVMVCGVKVLGLFAKGMRKTFNGAAKSFFSILVSKFKDKKTMVIDETQKTLENFLFCLTNIEEVQEDFKDALKEKVLGVKLNVLIWFEKFLEKMIKTQVKSLQSIKTVSPAIKVLLDDGSAEIRDYSTKILGKIKAIYGKEFIPGFFGDIQPTKMQKIEDAEERFRNDRGLTKENSNSVNPTNNQQQNTVLGNNTAKIQVEKTPVNNGNKKENTTKPGNNNKHQQIDKKVKFEQITDDTAHKTPKLSLEGAEQLLRENSAESLLTGLDTTCPWAEKVEALKELPLNYQAKFEDNPNLLEAFLVVLRHRLKDWKESNINIIKQVYTMLTIISESPKPIFSKRILTTVIPLFIEKMAEGNKYSELLWGFIMKILAYTSPKFLLNEFLTRFNETINNDIKKAIAKTVNELVGFSIKLIELVSLQSLPFKELIEFGKFLSTSTNPTIKQATVNLMKCLYAYFGQQLNLFLKDLSQTFFKTLQSEFSKVKVLDEKDKKPKIVVIEDGEAKGGIKKAVDLLDSLPRVDISNEVFFFFFFGMVNFFFFFFFFFLLKF